MDKSKYTPGMRCAVALQALGIAVTQDTQTLADFIDEKTEALELLEALHEGRRAIGDHHAPNDCYATGPVTGDHFRDLVQCPACSFIAMYDAAIARATGATP